jgi:co-chaperonin GroES (HSP10)
MIKGSAEKLAKGALSATYTQTHENDLAHDIALGVTQEEIIAKYGMTEAEYKKATILYLQGSDKELEQFDHRVIEAPDTVQEEVIELLPEIKAEFGYQASPRHAHVFVKRVAKTHTSRLITPPAYDSDSDIGEVFAVGEDVKDLKKGQIVLFDKYAVDGPEFHLLDEDGDDIQLLRINEINVVATLTKTKRKDVL